MRFRAPPRTKTEEDLPVNRWILAYAIAIAIAGIAVHTHHSIAAVYDTSRQVAIEGVVTAFHFVNPHPFLMMHVKDASGQTQQWRLEIDNRSELAEYRRDSGNLEARGIALLSPAARDARNAIVSTSAGSIVLRTAFGTSRSAAAPGFVPRCSEWTGDGPVASLSLLRVRLGGGPSAAHRGSVDHYSRR